MKKIIMAICAVSVLAAAAPAEARGFRGSRGIIVRAPRHYTVHRPRPRFRHRRGRPVYYRHYDRSDAWIPVAVAGTALVVGAIAASIR